MPPKIRSAPPPAGIIRLLPLAQRQDAAGQVVQAIIRQLIDEVNPRRVWLFGSRARDDAHLLSDIDIAFEGARRGSTAAVRAWLDEHAPTLLDIDLVDLDAADPALRAVVREEGILLYERTG